MNIVKLSDSVSVSEQILPKDVAGIAAAGFKVIVNNRPDGEAQGQPSSADIARAARGVGLIYYHLPITAANFPGPDVELMMSLLDGSDAPVLAFCRSGTRCANLWVSTRPGGARSQAVELARSLGFDLSMSSGK